MDIKQLQLNDSSYYLFGKQVNRCQGDGFSSVGTLMGAIKLAIAGSYLGLVAQISYVNNSLVCRIATACFFLASQLTIVSFDGNYVATGSSDLTVRLWDISTGECI